MFITFHAIIMKVEPLESETADTKTEFLIHFAINAVTSATRPTFSRCSRCFVSFVADLVTVHRPRYARMYVYVSILRSLTSTL